MKWLFNFAAATLLRFSARAKNETAQSSNVRAANMSALPDDPGHFWRWLSNRAEGPMCPDRYCFALRLTYEDYLASLIAPTTSGESTLPRLTVVHGQCVYLSEDPTSVTVTLADGPRSCRGRPRHRK